MWHHTSKRSGTSVRRQSWKSMLVCLQKFHTKGGKWKVDCFAVEVPPTQDLFRFLQLNNNLAMSTTRLHCILSAE